MVGDNVNIDMQKPAVVAKTNPLSVLTTSGRMVISVRSVKSHQVTIFTLHGKSVGSFYGKGEASYGPNLRPGVYLIQARIDSTTIRRRAVVFR